MLSAVRSLYSYLQKVINLLIRGERNLQVKEVWIENEEMRDERGMRTRKESLMDAIVRFLLPETLG